jgi:DNA-binding CsgD family transcriptional regulator/pimeloyl-ACP methyl ester carboxylesterase
VPLAQRFRLVQYDPRGQGLSTRGLTKVPAVAEHVADLDKLCRYLHLHSVMLYGSTIMSPVAVAFAARHPGRVRGLVLEKTALEWPAPLLALMKVADESYEMYLDLLAGAALRYQDREEAKARMRASMTYEEVLKSHARPDPFKEMVPHLTRLAMPVLIVVPAVTHGMPFLEEARTISAMIPDANLVFAPGENYTLDGVTPGLVAILEAFHERLVRRSRRAELEVRVALTEREIEVLRLLSAGKTNRQIASTLVISPNTVGRHVANIFAKTGAANRAEAASYAHRNLLV